MKTRLMIPGALMVMGALLALPAAAAEAKSDAVKKDIASHRAMAEAHTNAAACLEAGKSEKECHAQLQKDCKGVGIGKHCGMKHSH